MRRGLGRVVLDERLDRLRRRAAGPARPSGR